MAERLAHRELRNRSSEILRAVASGVSYEITNHGEVVARLVPVAGAPGKLQVRPARIRGHWDQVPATEGEPTSEEVLAALREDR